MPAHAHRRRARDKLSYGATGPYARAHARRACSRCIPPGREIKSQDGRSISDISGLCTDHKSGRALLGLTILPERRLALLQSRQIVARSHTPMAMHDSPLGYSLPTSQRGANLGVNLGLATRVQPSAAPSPLGRQSLSFAPPLRISWRRLWSPAREERLVRSSSRLVRSQGGRCARDHRPERSGSRFPVLTPSTIGLARSASTAMRDT